MESRRNETTHAPTVPAGRREALLPAAALAGAISVYALLAVIVLLSAQHRPAWETWLVAVPVGALALSLMLAAPAAHRRREHASTKRRGDPA